MADSLSHARHDLFAVAASIGSRDVPSTVATCPQCGGLHRDLLWLQSALRHAWTPRRQRDFRLDTIDLARLRPALWRRLLALIGSSRDAISRPLAVGLTSVGIVGVVLTSTASGLNGLAGGAAPPEVTIKVTGDPGAAPGDVQVAQGPAPGDPVRAISASALAAGGAVFAIRRIASRARRMR